MVGKILGHYKILEPLGKGGMGEVYRARDTKLDRDVAIKVLPEDFATDQDRLARFEREAKLLASLNHANIAAIYGLEDEGDQRFIVMEVVEGETLAERIASSGRMEVEEALEIARQIAEALEAAHENGVIHRDLKPANVIVTPDGKVKVLDFGLAKAYEADGSPSEISPDLSASPTMAAATRTGVIMGTAAYMSPEQARGKPVDKRSDIWAFGAVLYEMLSGRRAFDGETVSDTLAAILKESPDWSQLDGSVPGGVQRLLRRCLTKDPRQRMRDIGDARLEIGDALSAPEPAGASIAPPPGRPYRSLGIPWKLVPIALLVVVAGTVLVTVATMSVLEPRAPELPRIVTQFEIPLTGSERLTRTVSVPAVSPTGDAVAYTVREGTNSRILIRRLDALETIPVAGTEGGHRPFFSPNGEWIGFSIHAGGMYKVPVAGGERSLLAPGPWWSPNAVWVLDDQIIADNSGNMRRLVSVDVDTRDVTPITERHAEGELWHLWPEALPDGTVLFAVLFSDRTILARYFPERGDWTPLGTDGSGPIEYLRSGHILFQQAGATVVAPFDPSVGGAIGPATRILEAADPQHVAVSPSGTVAYVHFPEGTGRSLVRIDRSGSLEPLIERREPYRWPRLSPDGQRLVVGIQEVRESRLWLVDLADGRRDLLQDGGAQNTEPVWTRDGERIAYSSVRPTADVYWQAGRGGGESEMLSEEPIDQWPTSFSPDGKLLAFYGGPTGADQDIWVVPTEGGGAAQVVVDDPGTQRGGRFSPDGRWLLYSSTEVGESAIYVQRYPELDRKFRVSSEGGVDPVWSSDGLEIFYLDGTRMTAVAFDTDAEFPVGEETELFDAVFGFDSSGDQSYDVFPDGQSFVMMVPDLESPPRLFVITEFFEQVDRLFSSGQSP